MFNFSLQLHFLKKKNLLESNMSQAKPISCIYNTRDLFLFLNLFTPPVYAYLEQRLHQLFLPLLTLRTALRHLDDHSHVS